MSREPVAWVFNLDAEDELLHGGPHTPSKQTRLRVEGLLPVLSALLAPGDEVLWPGNASVHAKWGRAWCPTPWALQQISRAGLQSPPVPPASVLRRVNHRKFAQELGQALPGAQFVESEEELLEVLADSELLARVSMERNWLLKRPLGYAGRGRRKIASQELNATDRTWIHAALRDGDGLQVEPVVARELDCGLHGWLESNGALTLGRTTVQRIDPAGTWISTSLASAGELSSGEEEMLRREAEATAKALHAAGYYGPFGIDAFRWRAPDGALHFQRRCELNARYSMGWAIGMK